MADKSLPGGDSEGPLTGAERPDSDRRAFLRRVAIGLPIVLATVPARTMAWPNNQNSPSCPPSANGSNPCHNW